MSYRRTVRSTYDVRRLHVQFRNVWEQGLRRASQIMNELRSKGWDVDEDLYFSSQADREAETLMSEGFMVQKEPIIKWGDDEIYILAYKPSPTPPPTKPAPKTRTVDPKQNFERLFWGKKRVEEKYVKEDFVISPDGTVAFVTPNSTELMARGAEEAIKDASSGHGVVKELDYQELLEHQRNGKKYVTATLNGDAYGYSIEKVKKAIRVFGLERSKTRHAKAYISDQTENRTMAGVMIVTDGSGNKVLICPVQDPNSSLSAPL